MGKRRRMKFRDLRAKIYPEIEAAISDAIDAIDARIFALEERYRATSGGDAPPLDLVCAASEEADCSLALLIRGVLPAVLNRLPAG